MNALRSSVFAIVLGALAAPVGLPADDPIGDNLGTINFSVSGDREAQEHVVRGVKLLHHMMYPEADREFARAAEIDQQCALAGNRRQAEADTGAGIEVRAVVADEMR